VDPTAAFQTVAIQAAVDATVVEDNITVMGAKRPILSVPGRQYVTAGHRLAFQVSASSASGEPTSVSLAALPPGAGFDSMSGTFQWVPGESESGTWKLMFSASDGPDTVASEVIVTAGSGVPLIEELRDTANGSSGTACSPGSLVSLRGGWLAATSESDWSGDRQELGGAAVLVNGSRVPVLAASPTEVTFKCPNTLSGSILNLEVETAAGRSQGVNAVMRESTVAILTVHEVAGDQAAATILDSELAMPRNYRYLGLPAQAGDAVRIPVIGLSADSDPSSLTALIGDIPVPVRSVTALTGITGMVHVGIVIPAAAPIGDAVPLRVQHLQDGCVISSQTASIAIEAIRR